MERGVVKDVASPPRPQYFHLMSLGLLISVPLGIFTVLTVLFAFAFHRASSVVWVIVGLSFGLSLVFMAVRPTREGPRYWFNLGFLCLVATSVAVACGNVNWKRNFSRYWAYDGQRTYTNVLPNEAALSHLDAGKILFSEDAHIDLASAVGFKDEKLFCVAPIVGQTTESEVEYWAAGIGCCGKAGTFDCDDAKMREAHGGLVHLEHTSNFVKAAKQAQALNGLVSSEDALFVQWVENPDQAQKVYWHRGVTFAVGGIIIYVVFALLCGCMLHFRRAPAKMKMDFRNV